jgi:predicted nucleotidyltransferase
LLGILLCCYAGRYADFVRGCSGDSMIWNRPPRALIKALAAEGLIEAVGRDGWQVTQAGQTLSVATAAKRVTRATAENTLQRFLDRVQRVNNDPYFLGKVTSVVLFGSMLKPEIERLSDVDVAIELAPKDADFDSALVKNYQRVEELAAQGHRFRNFVEREGCWYWEVFGFLKGQDRVLALATRWRRLSC